MNKLEFIDLTPYVTFLCPNKKVTKEVVRGEALRTNRRNYGAIATGNRPVLIRCAEHHLAPDPTPAAFDHRPLKMSRFSAGSAVLTCKFAECKRSKIGTFLNAGWRCGGGYLRGRDLPVAPLRSASFGPFLAETRKGRIEPSLR